MYQPRRLSETVPSDRADDAPAYRVAARRAAISRTVVLRNRIAPAALTLGLVAASGALALNLNTAAATTPAVPAPTRVEETLSRDTARTAEPSAEPTEEATPKAEAVAAAESAEAIAATESAEAPAPTEAWGTGFGAVTGEQYAHGELIVRAQPSQESEQIGTLAKGDTVSTTDLVLEGYRQVTIDGRVGYVWAERLADEAPVEETAAPAESDSGSSSGSSDSSSAADSGNTFLWPTAGKISSPWGMRMHPILGYARLHGGVDIGGSAGQPIYAAMDGTVTKAASGYNGGSGNNVRISHGTVGGKSLESAYLHMTSIHVSAGQTVKRGQVIGTVGSTGLSTAPHLHFSAYVNGVNSDPVPYLNG